MNPIHQYINHCLQQRKEENNFRALKLVPAGVDFTSNDYLGLAHNASLKQTILQEVEAHQQELNGSTGSRLLSGNSSYAEALEAELALFHQAESALIFNSGFTANYGVLSTLPYKGDTIIYDQLVHASIHDGIRNSKADSVAFKHNSLQHLEQCLQSATGLKYVVVESVYSMDGDFAPLTEIADLCKQYNAGLIVDEAHATGIYGPNGEGRVVELGLQDKCLARIHTFGKAMGGHGAVVIGNQNLKEFLINYCRAFIYSTALSFHSLAAIKCAYRYIPDAIAERRQLFTLISMLKAAITKHEGYELLPSSSPIQSIVVSGNNNIKYFAETLQQQGLDVRPILTPTVPKGAERIRICLHSFNTEQEVLKLAQAINQFETATTT